ncbi:MAG: flagellar hook-length control protein FliK, partial [Rhodobacteraceae bacterium]|nr:flagellar hook-length control protein FliK [Paracoccaceae bacterium]
GRAGPGLPASGAEGGGLPGPVPARPSDGRGEEETLLRADPGAPPPSEGRTSGQALSPALRPPAAQVARALGGEIVSRPLPDTVEIALDPPELGRLRLSLSLGGPEGGLGIALSAERPETLDLLRRHAPDLLRELRGLGLGDVALDFGAGQSGQAPAPPRPDAQAPAMTETSAEGPLPEATMHQPPPTAPGRLDLRL